MVCAHKLILSFEKGCKTLSVTYGDSSPKGRALGKEGNFSVLPRAPSVRELARKRLKEFVFYLFFSCSASSSRGVM